MKKSLLLIVMAIVAIAANAQVKIGDNKTTINKGSALEIETPTKGILFPRVALKKEGEWSLEGNDPKDGMVIYNTAETGTLKKGLYQWVKNKWVRFVDTDTQKENIYTIDGKLTSERTVDMDGENLSFNNGVVYTNKDMDIHGVRVGHGEGAQPNNIAIGNPVSVGGDGVLGQNTTGDQNVAIGANALRNNNTGNGNLAFGTNALRENNGNNNIALGTSTLPWGTGSNRLAIGGAIYGTDVYDINEAGEVTGNPSANTKIGIGTNAPTTTLHVAGKATITEMEASADGDQIVMVGADGVLKKKAVPEDNNTNIYTNDGTIGDVTTGTAGERTVTMGEKHINFVSTTGQVKTSNDMLVNGITVGNGKDEHDSNTALGYNALAANASDNWSTAVGYEALKANTTSVGNTAVGLRALTKTTGESNTAVGADALANNEAGINNVAVGRNALQSNTATSNSTAVGFAALQKNTAASATAVGASALLNNTAEGATAVGASALQKNTTGAANTAIGYQAANTNTTGAHNTTLGYQAAYTNSEGANNTAIGSRTLVKNTASNNTAVGRSALENNTTGQYNVALGTNTLQNNTQGKGNVAIGNAALLNNNWDGTKDAGSFNTALGHQTLYENTTGNNNVALGREALYNNTTGVFNMAIGSNALKANTEGKHNVGVGAQSLYKNTTGEYNTAIGSQALRSNNKGKENVAIGSFALYGKSGEVSYTTDRNTIVGYKAFTEGQTGSDNVVLGWQALIGEKTVDAKKNVIIGSGANANNAADNAPTGNTVVGFQSIVEGNNNITLGAGANLYTATSGLSSNNRLNIGNAIYGTAVNVNNAAGNAIDYTNLKIGIGIAAPENTLDVNGKTRVRDLNHTLKPNEDKFIVAGNDGVLKKSDASIKKPWSIFDGTPKKAIATEATANYQDIWQGGRVGVGFWKDATFTNDHIKFEVKGNAMVNKISIGSGHSTGATLLAFNNTVLGADALAAALVEHADNNVAIGFQALTANTAGANNLAIGATALLKNASGSGNVAIGYGAGSGITKGKDNIAIGNSAGNNITTGENNIAIGKGVQIANAETNNQLNIGNAIYGTNINTTTPADAKIGIGTATPSVKLEVNGKVKATSFTSATKTYPDYVFEQYYNGFSDLKSDYQFKNLSEIEAFVKINKHLPGYKSAAEVQKEGFIDMTQTQITNMEKIEELYLHTIEQENKIKLQQTQINAQQTQINELKAMVKALIEAKKITPQTK